MKKVLKVVLVVMLVPILLIAALLAVAALKNRYYYRFSDPAGEIERRYTAMGKLAVTRREYPSENSKIGRFVLWYPQELERGGTRYPVVLWANGTGSHSATYTPFLRHLASWGFIVVSSDDENPRGGDSLNAGIDLLISEEASAESVFYHRVDLEHIGVAGHSQGGCAAYQMAAVQPHAPMIRAVCAISATSSYHTQIFQDGWEYDLSGIRVPTLMVAGTGTFDAGTAPTKETKSDEERGILQGITPLWSLQENFDALPEDIDKVCARRSGVDHGESHLRWDGYLTAWFSWYLQGDETARRAFFGPSPELAGNRNDQDVQLHEGGS